MTRKISIIGIPMDFGQSLRGVDMGPSAVRYSGLIPKLRALGYDVEDTGDIPIPVREEPLEEIADPKEAGRYYLDQITHICEAVYRKAAPVVKAKRFPLFLGGDHSVSIGTIAAAAGKKECGLIWVDAHADFNTPQTSLSGNIHGMPLAVLLGEGFEPLVNVGYKGPKIKPENVVLIGLRDIDPEEKKRIRAMGLTVFTMRDIDEKGISQVAGAALKKLKDLKKIHLTLDMDALEPEDAPGVGTPVPGGISYREAHLLMETLADSGKITSMDLVEINPILDVANKTAQLAVELTLSALGKSIL